MVEDDLISGIKSGSTKAFEHLYALSFDAVLKMVLQNSGTFIEAQDLMQETLMAVHRNVLKPDFKLTSSMKTYLYSIAYRKWMMVLRNRKIPLASLKEGDIEWIPVDESGLEDKHEKEHTYKLIENQITFLSSNCQTILHAFYYLNESLEIIAKRMNMTADSVKVTKYRCLKKLRQRLL